MGWPSADPAGPSCCRRQLFARAGAALGAAAFAGSASAKAGQFGKIGIFGMEDISSPFQPGGPKSGPDSTYGYAKSDGPILATGYEVSSPETRRANLVSFESGAAECTLTWGLSPPPSPSPADAFPRSPTMHRARPRWVMGTEPREPGTRESGGSASTILKTLPALSATRDECAAITSVRRAPSPTPPPSPVQNDVTREKAMFVESARRLKTLQPKIDSKTWWFVRCVHFTSPNLSPPPPPPPMVEHWR